MYQFEELETKITLNGLKYFVLLSHSEVGETIFSQRHKMQFFFLTISKGALSQLSTSKPTVSLDKYSRYR